MPARGKNTVLFTRNQERRQSGADAVRDPRRDRSKRFHICPACPERFGSYQTYHDHWKERHAK